MSCVLPTKIVIADDHAFFRQGVQTALKPFVDKGLYVLEEASTGKDVIQVSETSSPHVILMDVHMPDLDGIQATVLIKRRFPQIHILGLSYSEESDVVLAMVDAGCDGYLLKNTSQEELVLAFKTVCAGGTYFAPAISGHLATGIKQAAFRSDRPLTPREVQILQLVCGGNTSKEIAATLHLSKRTVDTNREKIMRKTGVRNAFDLLRYAIKNRLYKP